MQDSELAAIRAKRMAELKSQGSTAGTNAGMAGLTENNAEKQQQIDEMKHSMLSQILSNEARERLARIRIVKEEKAAAVEDLLIRMAQTGQIRGRVSENELIGFLDQMNNVSAKSTKITYNRRRMDDSDEEDWGL